MIRASKLGSVAAVAALALTLSPVSPASAAPCARHAMVRHQINSLRDELRDVVTSQQRRASHGEHATHGSQMRKVQKFVRTVRKQIAC